MSFIYCVYAFKCLFVCVDTFVRSFVFVYVRTRKHAFVSLSLLFIETEWCLLQSYNGLNVILNATQSFVLGVWQKCGKQSFWRAANQPKKKRKTLKLYTQTNTNERSVHTAVWAYECVAGKCHPFDSEYAHRIFFICTIFPFASSLACSLHVIYAVSAIRERSYVLWSLFIKRLHTNGNCQPKPYTELQAMHFRFRCVYTHALESLRTSGWMTFPVPFHTI